MDFNVTNASEIEPFVTLKYNFDLDDFGRWAMDTFTRRYYFITENDAKNFKELIDTAKFPEPEKILNKHFTYRMFKLGSSRKKYKLKNKRKSFVSADRFTQFFVEN